MDILKALATEDRGALEEYCRSRAMVMPSGDRVLICRVLGEYLMACDQYDVSVSPHLCLEGHWEMWVTQAIARIVRPRMRVIDVGANCGYYTMLLSRLVGPDGYVEAYEPQPKMFSVMNLTMRLNGCPEPSARFMPYELAAGSARGCAQLYRPYMTAGACRNLGGVSLNPIPGTVATDEVVNVVPLDAHRSGPVDFVKIDSEGHEPEVWKGSAELRKESPGLELLIEFTPRLYAAPAEFLDQILSEGYRTHAVDGGGRLRPIGRDQLLSLPDWEMLHLTKKAVLG